MKAINKTSTWNLYKWKYIIWNEKLYRMRVTADNSQQKKLFFTPLENWDARQSYSVNSKEKPDLVVNTYNLDTWEAEAELLQVWGQVVLQRKNSFQPTQIHTSSQNPRWMGYILPVSESGKNKRHTTHNQRKQKKIVKFQNSLEARHGLAACWLERAKRVLATTTQKVN